MTDWSRTVKPQRGYVYKTDDGARISITRVARDGSWADIIVTQPNGASWVKRQPLLDGLLPYRPVIWDTAGREHQL